MVRLAKKDYPDSENNVDPKTHPINLETISAPQMNILIQKLHGRCLRHDLLGSIAEKSRCTVQSILVYMLNDLYLYIIVMFNITKQNYFNTVCQHPLHRLCNISCSIYASQFACQHSQYYLFNIKQLKICAPTILFIFAPYRLASNEYCWYNTP